MGEEEKGFEGGVGAFEGVDYSEGCDKGIGEYTHKGEAAGSLTVDVFGLDTRMTTPARYQSQSCSARCL